MARARVVLTIFSLSLGVLGTAGSAADWFALAAIATASISTGLADAATEAKTFHNPTEQAYVLVDGVTAPVYDYAAAIRESAWVQVPDLNCCGAPVQVAADIIRPSELAGKTTVPVIMVASPYYLCCGRGNESEVKTYDAEGNPTKFPLFYDNYFVPRGYAFVAVDMAGTARSTGCSDEGAASDILSVKTVVDWLNGRATAVDRRDNPVRAEWSNGTVGMIGKSYDGTLGNGVAAMGVPGLKTIVPIGAISSWYDYDRYQNVPFSYDYPTYLSEYVAGNRTAPVDCSECFANLAAEDGDETGARCGLQGWCEPGSAASHAHTGQPARPAHRNPDTRLTNTQRGLSGPRRPGVFTASTSSVTHRGVSGSDAGDPTEDRL